MRKSTLSTFTALLMLLGVFLAPPAHASSLATQSTKLTLDGSSSVGQVISAWISNEPENAKSTYKWTSGSTVLGSENSLTVPAKLANGKLIDLSVTVMAPGFKKFTSTFKGIIVGQIAMIKKGGQVGMPEDGRPIEFAPDLIFPSVRDHQGNLVGSESNRWFADQEFVTDYARAIIPPSSAIGKHIILKSTYSYGSLPPLEVTRDAGIMKGALFSAVDGTISGAYIVGQTLTLSTEPTWNVTPDSVTYKWTKNGVAIPNATGLTYKIRPSDWHSTIGMIQIAKKKDYFSAYVPISLGRVLKEVTVTGKVRDGSDAWELCEAYTLENILCTEARSNPKWLGAINLVKTQDDVLYVSLSARNPVPAGSTLHKWKATFVGLSSSALYIEAATAVGVDFAIESVTPAKFEASPNKDTNWVSPWFTAPADVNGYLNFGLWDVETSSFVIKTVQITAVYLV